METETTETTETKCIHCKRPATSLNKYGMFFEEVCADHKRYATVQK